MHADLQTALTTVSGLSYLGVFGLSLLANMVVPVPEEIFLLALGYLVAEGFFHPVLVVLVIITGFMISDTVLYLFAQKGNKWLIRTRDKMLAKFNLSEGDFVERHINKVIFFSRFLVQFRFLGPVLAGSYKVPYKQFFNTNLLALLVYVPIFVVLGDYFHDRIEQVLGGIGVVRNIIFAVLGIVIVIVAFHAVRLIFIRYLQSIQRRVKGILEWKQAISMDIDLRKTFRWFKD